ncbi:MAG: sigma-70 family RNA polymerase sigma factor [Clostridia bacterium]|nr:sigma-70 family RNA polymerase sigma factor [Clostridia bacterium]
MEDRQIVALYWERNEQAIAETANRYGKYCHTIAMNILAHDLDAEECVNDTYLRAWNSIPPHRPEKLSCFLGKITRNLALNRYAAHHAKKRNGGIEVALEELAEVLADPESEANDIESTALASSMNGFLADLPKRTRVIFLQRYWYLCSIADIAKNVGISENRVKVTLHRARQRLRAHLEKEGISL